MDGSSHLASGDLKVAVLRGRASTTLRLEGELDLASVDLLLAAGAQIPDDAGEVRVDLSGLAFIDGAGADALSAFHAAQVIRGREVRLTQPRRTVRWTLHVLHLGWLLEAPDAATGRSASSALASPGRPLKARVR